MGKYCLQKEKIDQTKKYLKENDIDCWLIKTKEGSDPCMSLIFGFTVVGEAIMIITQRKTYSIVSIIDAQDSEECGLFDEVIKYGKEGIKEHLINLLSQIKPKKIAINYSKDSHLSDGLTVGSYRNLMDMVGSESYEFISSEMFLQRLRSIKSKQEIEYIQKAIDLTLEIYDVVFTKIRKGMSEIEIGNLFIEEMKRLGVVNGISRKLTPPIVMKCNIAHRPPSNAIIEGGDYLIFDFSVDYKGYCSDIARTCYVLKDGEEKASEEMDRAFKVIYEAVNKAVDSLRPGTLGFEVDRVARQYVVDMGYPNIIHAVGHQIGRNVHDGGTLLAPDLKRYKKGSYGIIEEGMVFAVEPTILYTEGPAIISEENVLITNNGAIFLSKRQESLVLIK
ncbi:aminopeptidase P family protein [Mycoplasmatota bacterium]|nr:aminopeptidase P family protein [Mycoplasmatota bacterium]